LRIGHIQVWASGGRKASPRAREKLAKVQN
jgi:hypothetical protein